MDKKELQAKLIDYLYDEMSPDERKAFEAHLRDHPDLQQELDEMAGTRRLFGEDSDDITPGKLMLIDLPDQKEDEEEVRKPATIFTLKALTAVAAALLLAVLLFTVANLQITQTDSGTLISFGSAPNSQPQTEPEPDVQTEQFITEDEFYALLAELQQENNRMMASALEQTQAQHREQMQDVVQTLTNYYDRRRQQDLMLISEGLATLEEETYYRFLQTEAAFEDLLFALNVQPSNE